jgi:ATP-binding cassette subfamily G (WHITE) protein 2 (PDR)
MTSQPLPLPTGSAAGELLVQTIEHIQNDRVESPDNSAIPVPVSDEDRDEHITNLARSLSHISRQRNASIDEHAEGVNTFLDTSDPELDPNSGHFKSRKWVKNMLQMTCHDPDRYPRRTAGVSFRNLNVFGYGTAADYQMTFANFWLKAAGWLRGALGFGRKVRIDILRDFEGFVHSGEMLVVLGRPGRYVKRLAAGD